MIGFCCAIKGSRTDAEGRVFLTIQIAPQYRLKAAAVAAMTQLPLIANIAAEGTGELEIPPEDKL